MGAAVSIIVRSMDRPSLRRALDSISAQSLRPSEVVVVAACGARHGALPAMHPDIEARLIVAPPGVAALNRPCAGNAGLRAARHEWLGFLDDDDEYLPTHIETLFPVAQAVHERAGARGRLVYSLAQGVDREGRATDVYGRSFSFVHIWDNTILHTMNALLHRSLLAEGVAFDESLEVLEDWDFWIQCSQRTAFAFVEQVTTHWHGDEGESGCGFGANAQDQRYRAAQAQVRAKWSAEREATLGRIRAMQVQALEAAARGDFTEAVRLSRSVLHVDPENADMANVLGAHALRTGDLVSAAQLFDAAIRNSPPHAGLCLNRGLVELARGDHAAARAWFTRGLSIDPGNSVLRSRLDALEGGMPSGSSSDVLLRAEQT
jgi:tetratricopeptide (TPR) repeat protein